MIKDIIENRLKSEYRNIINEIDAYMGFRYSDFIQEMAKKINIKISNEYFDEENKEELFLEKEPICIKNKDSVDIVIPASYFYIENGNVTLVHLLLHALLKNKISNSSEVFNETIIDYMAEKISKSLEEKGINVTICDYPSYSSSSFYSLMFDEIEEFYENNKNSFIDNFMGKEVQFKENIVNMINFVESKAKNIMFDRNAKTQDNIKRR